MHGRKEALQDPGEDSQAIPGLCKSGTSAVMNWEQGCLERAGCETAKKREHLGWSTVTPWPYPGREERALQNNSSKSHKILPSVPALPWASHKRTPNPAMPAPSQGNNLQGISWAGFPHSANMGQGDDGGEMSRSRRLLSTTSCSPERLLLAAEPLSH